MTILFEKADECPDCGTPTAAEGWHYDGQTCTRCGYSCLRLATCEQLLAEEILAELTRARAKFTGKNVTFAALVEEVGELATATFAESRANVRKEAVQVAVMAMRMVLDGDHTFDAWREAKGLDGLVPPGPPPTEQQKREQGAGCRCRGGDDMCPCQNVVWS